MNNKILLTLTAAFGLLSNKTLANEVKTDVETDKKIEQSDLTFQLIKNQAFKINSDKTISIDEEALIRTIKNDLQLKLKDKNTEEIEKALYQNLILRLKPNSFNNQLDNEGFKTMSFSKS